MSAAALAEWLTSGGATVPGAGFVPLCPQSRTETATPKNDPLIGKTGVCALVPAVPAFFEGVEVEREKSRPDQAANDDQAPAPGTAPAPDWQQADADYLRHHFGCLFCCAAGQGRGHRCATGAELWSTYEAACEAAQTSNTNGRRIR